MKIYKWVFIVLSLAQGLFALIWLLLMKTPGRIIALSFIIYAGGMLVGYIAYEVEKYRQKRKDLIDHLP
jgi:hypothetical protein